MQTIWEEEKTLIKNFQEEVGFQAIWETTKDKRLPRGEGMCSRLNKQLCGAGTWTRALCEPESLRQEEGFGQ